MLRAFDKGPAALPCDISKAGYADEAEDKFVGRIVVNIQRRINLLHNAKLHNQNTVTEGHSFGLIMGYVDDRKTIFTLQILDFKAHFLAQVRVKAGQWFIKQHNIRVDCQRTC